VSTNPKTLTPEQEKAAREAFETRYKGFTWWTEKYGELHPALHKDENGDYLEESQRKYWKGFQEGYAAALGVTVVARDEAAELRAWVREWAECRDIETRFTTDRAGWILHNMRRLAGGESER
jgi:hypothetical protein